MPDYWVTWPREVGNHETFRVTAEYSPSSLPTITEHGLWPVIDRGRRLWINTAHVTFIGEADGEEATDA